MPPSLSIAVTYHHEPMKATNFMVEAAILHISELLVCEMGLGGSSEPAIPTMYKETFKLLNLNLPFINEAKKEINECADNALDMIF